MLDHLGEVAGPGRALLISPEKRPSYIRDIEDAFRAWCLKDGREHQLAVCRDDVDSVTDLVAADIQSHGRPQAILIGVLDRHAAWAQRAILNSGFAVPGDVVVAAATDGESLRLVDPTITALDLDGGAHGAAAVELLLAQVEVPGVRPPDTLIPARFTIRASSGA
jgi:DNA-binding LacI/PurR family transcriptional regulator